MRKYNAEHVEIIARMIEGIANEMESKAAKLRTHAARMRIDQNFVAASWSIETLTHNSISIGRIHDMVTNYMDLENSK